MHTVYVILRDVPDNVHTGVNFVDKVESCAMIRFVRVTYVRPQEEGVECASLYSPPKGSITSLKHSRENMDNISMFAKF